MEKLSVLAPAKINLYLGVTGKRADGYHEIASVMQSVTLFDRVRVEKRDVSSGKRIAVHCRDAAAPDGEDNTVYRAAVAFFAATGIDAYDVSFLIEKKIPSQAGLGGGSSDGAAALLALDRMFGTSLSTEKLCEIGATVGADVPFCVRKGTVFATGIGEKLADCTPMPDCAIVIAMPNGGHISTAEAYRRIDGEQHQPPMSGEAFLSEMATCDLDRIARSLYNEFETVTPPETGFAALIGRMTALGALGARLSGSGSAVYGLFRDLPTARAAKDALDAEYEAFLCTPARRERSVFED